MLVIIKKTLKLLFKTFYSYVAYDFYLLKIKLHTISFIKSVGSVISTHFYQCY